MKESSVIGTPGFDRREDEGIDTCTTCPKLCRWACPVAEAEARETSSPWNLVTMSGLLKRGVASPQALGDLAFHCSQCGACTEACRHGNDVALWMAAARSRASAAHLAPEAVSEVRGHFAVSGNAYGAPLDKHLDQVLQASESGAVRTTTSRGVVYLPGCATLVERPEAAVGFLRALALRGVKISVSDASAGCCGLPLFWAGDLDGFRAHAQRYVEQLGEATQVVVHDAACGQAITQRYADVGVKTDVEVVHASAFLAERLGVPPLERDEEERVDDRLAAGTAELAYMDTCHLARASRLVSTPRRLVARCSGAAPAELPGLRGVMADCCGAAGLLPITAPHTATAMAEARIEAFRSTGASRLAVMTPRCAAHLSRVDPTIDVVDVATLLARLT